MYQPPTPLIEMIPGLRTKRLSEVELGRLVLCGDAPDTTQAAGIAIRADALSRGGDVTEGLVRLGGGRVRFERRELDQNVVAIDIQYVLEPDLTSVTVRSAEAGDLVLCAATGAGAGVLVAGPWQGLGLLDIASALLRPFADPRASAQHVTLAWQLVHREERRRVLFAREARVPERDDHHTSQRLRDDVPRFASEPQRDAARRYVSEEDD
jgi:hypothetical protein